MRFGNALRTCVLAIIFLVACEGGAVPTPAQSPTLAASNTAPPLPSATPKTISTKTTAITATTAPEATTTAQHPDCTSGWSRLVINHYARVTGKAGDPPNRVRSGPGKADEVIAEIYPQTVVRVVEGPVCADGPVFWKIESAAVATGFGWTAEGDGKDYYVEPYEVLKDGFYFSDLGVSLEVPEADAGILFEMKPAYSTEGSHPEFDEPEHISVIASYYPFISDYHPLIEVFRKSSYENLNLKTKQAILRVEQYISGGGDLSMILPLPPTSDKLILQSHVKFVDFPNGRGIRVIQKYQRNTIYPPFFEPVLNRHLVYVFMGFANYGRDFVAIQLPVSAPFLCDDYVLNDDASMTCDLPAGGISFENYGDDESDWHQYYYRVKKQLNAADEAVFSPSLDQLDAFVQSVLVTRP
jgi:hypothetical protein